MKLCTKSLALAGMLEAPIRSLRFKSIMQCVRLITSGNFIRSENSHTTHYFCWVCFNVVQIKQPLRFGAAVSDLIELILCDVSIPPA